MRYLFLTLLSIFSWTAFGQIHNPVDLDFSVEELKENKARLVITATLEEGWHIYHDELPPDAIALPTEFILENSDAFKTIGKLQFPKPIKEYDPIMDDEVFYHEGKVKIYQTIEKLSTKPFTVKGEFSFMVCNESTCLPPEYKDVEFQLEAAKKAPQAAPVENPSKDESGEEQEAANIAANTGSDALEIDYSEPDTVAEEEQSDSTAAMAQDKQPIEENSEPARSLLSVFIISFLGGFAALFTPCVFPMIPLTVSFFTKQSKNRAKGIANAILYGAAIIVLYTLLGILITLIFGSAALNAISTNPWVNIFFFVLLVVFAISFLGAFEITLPSSWVNKTDQASDKGGVLGIFFMALTLAIVSFSCTGPIIGGLLAEAAQGGIQGPAVGMFGFSLALALPFTLFAVFPGWLNSLPKSGGWLNSVKVVLGFLELAFAFKFLSNADLVWDAGILLREHFLAIWIAIFLLITFYLLGMFRMPHDSKVEKLSVLRVILAVGTLYFVVYLIPGLWGAPLKMISGFPPPLMYAEAPQGVGAESTVAAVSKSDIPEGAHPDDCPFQLNCFKDFEAGLAYAKKVNKPVMLDFTGKACVNCRRMEENVWSDPRVLDILRDDVVLISLYVDLRKDLPQEEQFVSDFTGKKVETVGEKWSEFQVRHFNSNSQPQYVLLNHSSMEPLNGTTAYDPDVEKYLNWLNEGIDIFEAQQNQ